MLKVKIFDEESDYKLEEEMNRFLSRMDSALVRDVRYHIAITNSEDDEEEGPVYCYSALLLYDV